MSLVTTFAVLLLWILLPVSGAAQCAVQIGPPVPSSFFITAGTETGLPHDRWLVAADSINGEYKPAIGMITLGQNYHNNGEDWLSFSSTGEHSSNRFYYFKIDFDLPCKNLCGKSYAEKNTYCLQLDLYTDNSVYEVFVNGVPQSDNLGKIIPLPFPFNPLDHTQKDKTTVTLCNDWKEGANSLIIQVASSATVVGLFVEPASEVLPPPADDSITATICEGEKYTFDNRQLSQPGRYYRRTTNSNGCEFVTLLNLMVNPVPRTFISKFICRGDSYLGYKDEGIYTDIFKGLNGCDSIRTLHLRLDEQLTHEFKHPLTLCEGDSLILSPGRFQSYTWQDGSTDSQLVVKKPGVYSVSVSSACGKLQAAVEVSQGTCDVAFPNAFTPNQDGRNDVFRIGTNITLANYKLSVYNRWGQLVFETTEVSKGWDGRLKGQLQTAGTYIWICTFEHRLIREVRKGTLQLIR